MSHEMRVGELARRTGLSVRTLHHWDHVGLFPPARRTPAGHRLYGPYEIERLQRILSLRSLGLGLEEIGTLLSNRKATLESVLRAHRTEVRAQRILLEQLETRLDRILNAREKGQPISPEDLLQTMETIAMIEKHYSPEQLEALKTRAEALGPEAIQEAQREWPRLIAAVREAMERGEDPASERVRKLAKRWSKLIQAFSGGDPGIERSLGSMYRDEPEMAARQGLDQDLFQYIGAAMRAGQDCP